MDTNHLHHNQHDAFRQPQLYAKPGHLTCLGSDPVLRNHHDIWSKTAVEGRDHDHHDTALWLSDHQRAKLHVLDRCSSS